MSTRNQTQSSEPKPAKKPVSLAEFMRQKAKGACLICRLPADIQAQLGKPASDKGYSRVDQVEWLRAVCGAREVTIEILTKHLNGRHYEEPQP